MDHPRPEEWRCASTKSPIPLSTNDASPKGERGAEDVQRRILIVEDDFLIAMQAESALIDAGFIIIGIATTAEEALVVATEGRQDVVIMDIRLAGARDGVDAAGDLFRELGLRCIFATAHDDQNVRNRAQPYSPLGWLTKPYTMASLTSVVRDVTSRE
jgi:DNA-binding NarL/FixJ family response regulator